MMVCDEYRQQVVRYCLKLAGSPLSSGTSGNISVFDRATGLMAISPSSMDYQHMAPEDVVLFNLDGDVVAGERRPSSEWSMHLACYRHRKDINAVVHTHSPAATTLAVLGLELPAVHYMIALGGRATVPVAPYHLYGTAELAEAAVTALEGGFSCLLESHGVLAAGGDLHQAWSTAEQIEFCADLYLRARALGEPKILTDAQIAEVIDQLYSYSPQH
jgi:L-fuculose-phosphate aldolase